VRRPIHVPLVHEISGAYGKAVAAVRVRNLEHWAPDTLSPSAVSSFNFPSTV